MHIDIYLYHFHTDKNLIIFTSMVKSFIDKDLPVTSLTPKSLTKSISNWTTSIGKRY